MGGWLRRGGTVQGCSLFLASGRWLPAASTVIGYGSENQGTDKVHGAPLGDKDLANSKQRLGFDPEKKFYIPEDVRCFPHASEHER